MDDLSPERASLHEHEYIAHLFISELGIGTSAWFQLEVVVGFFFLS